MRNYYLVGIIMLMMLLAACNITTNPGNTLENDTVPVGTDSAGLVPQSTSDEIPDDIIILQDNISRQAPTNNGDEIPCIVQSDWPTVTVESGDTLFAIATRTDSSIVELTQANCLADAALISVNQILHVPPSGTESGQPISYYVILVPPNGLPDCGAPVTVIERSDLRTTGNPATDVRTALNQLFAIDGQSVGSAGAYNQLAGSDLAVQSVSISGGTATIAISGNLQLIGVCADAQMEAQIMSTIFHYRGFDSADVRVNGRNLRQIFDAIGLVVDGFIYSRE